RDCSDKCSKHCEILCLQQLSLEAAQENFNRTRERFELGQSTSVAFRDAQINLLLAENRLNDLLYDVKTSEINLMQVSGNLLPQE
ncbi:MAG: TolC family protein, partial [Bacteroidota bacterium]